MYIPSSFVEEDIDKIHDFIDSHSFGILITQSSSNPIASHLPFLLDRESGSHGKLIGHVARANTQCTDADETEALAIFHGPHAYISPRSYAAKNVVPTWNYVAVHVHGTLHVVSDQGLLLQVLRETVEKYEDGSLAPWSIDEPDELFIDGLLDAIVGFEIEITRIEGKWKLSQNHTPERRQQVIDTLQQANGEQEHSLAELMSQALQEEME